jgi:hypothetical protein
VNRRKVLAGLLPAGISTATFASIKQQTAEANQAGAVSFAVRDVRFFGARGDGAAKDTGAIQRAIDETAKLGGGAIYVSPGTYMVGTIVLKSNVTLHLEAGATLLGSPDKGDYVMPKEAALAAKNDQARHLLFAFNAENIALVGLGKIDGGSLRFLQPLNKPRPAPGDQWHVTTGAYWGRKLHVSPMVEFAQCTNVRIQDVTLQNSLGWTLRPIGCRSVVIQGIRIRNPDYSPNADGIDPTSCENVMISDCDVDTGDDAICIKSNNVYSDQKVARNIVVTNCILSSACNGFKIGSEGPSGFENITFSNSVIYSRKELQDDQRVISAIDIVMPDGGWIEGVTISNISIRNARVPIFIRLQNITGNPDARMTAWIRSILISDIQAIGAIVTSSISGIPGYRVEDVTLRNIHIRTNEAGHEAWRTNVPPEREYSYAEGVLFGRFPAYGFYCRHLQGLTIDNIDIRSTRNDPRPVIVCDDVGDLTIAALSGTPPATGAEMIRLNNVCNATLRSNRAGKGTGAFVFISGPHSESISLFANDLYLAKRPVAMSAEVPSGSVRVDGAAISSSG